MNKPAKPQDGQPSPPTCESCEHTFRTKAMMNMLICVPHLKIMPAQSPICDLYSTGKQKNRASPV